MTVEERTDSEFGKGLTYCLGLFLAHAERWREDSKEASIMGAERPELWFNAASDHLYELQVPDTLPEELRARLKHLQDRALSWGHGFGLDGTAKATSKDAEWSLNEAKELLRLIDEQFGVPTIKATWK